MARRLLVPDEVDLTGESFLVDREVLEGMLDRARRGDDNDDILASTKGLEPVES
jgi:hypothetical protein